MSLHLLHIVVLIWATSSEARPSSDGCISKHIYVQNLCLVFWVFFVFPQHIPFQHQSPLSSQPFIHDIRPCYEPADLKIRQLQLSKIKKPPQKSQSLLLLISFLPLCVCVCAHCICRYNADGQNGSRKTQKMKGEKSDGKDERGRESRGGCQS